MKSALNLPVFWLHWCVICLEELPGVNMVWKSAWKPNMHLGGTLPLTSCKTRCRKTYYWVKVTLKAIRVYWKQMDKKKKEKRVTTSDVNEYRHAVIDLLALLLFSSVLSRIQSKDTQYSLRTNCLDLTFIEVALLQFLLFKQLVFTATFCLC